MADWNLPTLTTLYADVLTELKGRDETALKMDGSGTNLPVGAKKLNVTTGQFERYNGTTWAPITSYAKTTGTLDQFADGADGDNIIDTSGRSLRINTKRALVGLSSADGNKLFINYNNDFANGVEIKGETTINSLLMKQSTPGFKMEDTNAGFESIFYQVVYQNHWQIQTRSTDGNFTYLYSPLQISYDANQGLKIAKDAVTINNRQILTKGADWQPISLLNGHAGDLFYCKIGSVIHLKGAINTNNATSEAIGVLPSTAIPSYSTTMFIQPLAYDSTGFARIQIASDGTINLPPSNYNVGSVVMNLSYVTDA